MNSEKLFEAIGYIDDDFIEEADTPMLQLSPENMKKPLWVKLASAAAVFAVIVAAVILIPILTENFEPGHDGEPEPDPNGVLGPALQFEYEVYSYILFDDMSEQFTGYKITAYLGEAAEVIIPAEIDDMPVAAIDDSAFADRTDIISVTIPASIKYIGQAAFMNCTNLETVEILGAGLLWIDDAAFLNCTALTDINLPESLIKIGDKAFFKCTSLMSITIPDSVKWMGNEAFYGCINFTATYKGQAYMAVTRSGGGATWIDLPQEFYNNFQTTPPPPAQSLVSVGYADEIDPGVLDGRKAIVVPADNDVRGEPVVFYSDKELGILTLYKGQLTGSGVLLGDIVFSIGHVLPPQYYIEYAPKMDTEDMAYIVAVRYLSFQDITYYWLSFTEQGVFLSPTDIVYYNPDETLDLSQYKLAGDAELVLVQDTWWNYIAVAYDGHQDGPYNLCIEPFWRAIEVSPDGTKISYVMHDHGSGEFFIFDVLTKTNTRIIEFDRPQEALTPKKAIWLDNEIMLVIAGFDQGSVTRGGEIYYYHVDSGASGKVVDTNVRVNGRLNAEISRMEIIGENLKIDVSVYFNEVNSVLLYTETIPLNEIYEAIQYNRPIILETPEID